MVVGPFGTLVARRYQSDDGNFYSIGVWSDLELIGGIGDADVAGLPPFPGNWTPRYLDCVYLGGQGPIEPGSKFVSAVCNPTASGWTLGPGTHGVIAGREYEIASCRGEKRID